MEKKLPHRKASLKSMQIGSMTLKDVGPDSLLERFLPLYVHAAIEVSNVVIIIVLPIPFFWPATSATQKHSQEKERRGRKHAKKLDVKLV